MALTSRFRRARSTALAAAMLSLWLYMPAAHALSTLQDDGSAPSTPAANDTTPAAPADEAAPDDGDDAPGAVIPDDSDDDDDADQPPSDLVRPDVDPAKPAPEILYDVSKLPEPVRRMRELIIEACKSGDIEKLRPLLGTGDAATQLSLSGLGEDPIKFLHELSGDEGGQEILAILLEVMQQGYVHLNAGTPSDIYAWPYYFAVPLDKLTAPQRVQLFTLVTAGDYEDMKSFGAYNFYRAGITPEGRWVFFVAGD